MLQLTFNPGLTSVNWLSNNPAQEIYLFGKTSFQTFSVKFTPIYRCDHHGIQKTDLILGENLGAKAIIIG